MIPDPGEGEIDPARLRLAYRDNRLDFHRPPRRCVTRQERDGREHAGHDGGVSWFLREAGQHTIASCGITWR